MPELPLSQGRVALVDQDDYGRLSQFRWFYKDADDGRRGVPMRHVRTADGKLATEYLARAVANPPKGRRVVHKNRNRLDCRKENLAFSDRPHVQRRARVRRDSSSGIKGVRFDSQRGVWTAMLWRDRRGFSLGRFNSARGAAEAFKNAVARWEYIEANGLPRTL